MNKRNGTHQKRCTLSSLKRVEHRSRMSGKFQFESVSRRFFGRVLKKTPRGSNTAEGRRNMDVIVINKDIDYHKIDREIHGKKGYYDTRETSVSD